MESSPIADFYPRDFELDMNGKKQDWEAIVKIPFIDQDRLLNAMKSKWLADEIVAKQYRSNKILTSIPTTF